MGNIHSVNKALQLCKARTIVTNNPKEILSSSKVVLPGVGAFSAAMRELERHGLIPAIKEFIKSGRPLLGICLGMQLLLQQSQEAGKRSGLGMLKGRVVRFSGKNNLKVPHMGWNQLKINAADCPLLKGIPDNSYVYFCHSYYPLPQDKQISAATSDYGVRFGSLLWQDNIYGVQFHPEKSQAIGFKMIQNFVKIC